MLIVEMRLVKQVSVLLSAALSVAALRSPHEKAAQFPKRGVIRPLLTRDAPRYNSTTLFLNEKTESKLRNR
jgi:hypothetical protein